MTGHDDFQTEPVRGLPEVPPSDERILWQGHPDWRVLARRAFGVRTVLWYFGALALIRTVSIWATDGTPGEIAASALWFALLASVVVAILTGMAWLNARLTVYTITTRRVAMRIGVALTVTLNLPYRWIGAADLLTHPDGSGDIAFTLTGKTKLSYLVLWPHVRPWRMARPQPALRCVAGVSPVAAILSDAMQAASDEREAEQMPVEVARIAAE